MIVVATPIGNLGDVSTRARETLADADLVLAEDTRRTGRLLAHLGIATPQRSLHEHNEDARLGEVLARLDDGATVALVSDAGTPGVSDPGYRLVRACIDAGHVLEHVPGPSAVLAALVVSGLPTDRFTFEGFLPRKGSARAERLAALATERRTMVVFVSPHRAADDLHDLAATLGPDRPAALCRELTKLHEEVRRDRLVALAETADDLRGEVTLVIGGAPEEVGLVDADDLAAAVHVRQESGMTKKAAIADVAASHGVPKRVVYQAVVEDGASGAG
ncbi:MAG: 16S rRNA (cytidine(1402)-2'-O)-methyltransferase [Actinobacteria bacterium]|nr:16S rRNA (cytidine(1402)-2'-O)-methyltransferase [Actinomycetota bacterium]